MRKALPAGLGTGHSSRRRYCHGRRLAHCSAFCEGSSPGRGKSLDTHVQETMFPWRLSLCEIPEFRWCLCHELMQLPDMLYDRSLSCRNAQTYTSVSQIQWSARRGTYRICDTHTFCTGIRCANNCTTSSLISSCHNRGLAHSSRYSLPRFGILLCIGNSFWQGEPSKHS